MDSSKLTDLSALWGQRPYREALVAFLNLQAEQKLGALRNSVAAGDLNAAALAEGAIQALEALPSLISSAVSRERS